jgi:chromate transporter
VAAPTDSANNRKRLGSLAGLFLKLGIVGFGGPAAHISMMEDEIVARRGWLTRDHFLDLVGATNLIPGPNSTEMAIHVGYIRAGVPGLIVAGVCFILPAVLLSTLLALVYVEFGALPQVVPFLYGIKPVVLAIILGALWRLGKKAVTSWQLFLIGLAIAVAVLLGANAVVALFAGGILGMLILRTGAWLRSRGGASDGTGLAALFLASTLRPLVQWMPTVVHAVEATAQVPLWELFLFFLRIGAVLFGSGYVLFAFLEGGLVHDYGWLTQQQLLDAIAVGQFTPGPVLSTSAFIGYVIAGFPGATVAAIGIFLPSFFFVLILNRLIPLLRRSPWTAAFLDAVNVSAVGLMAAVLIRLGQNTLTSWPAWLLAVAAAAAVLWWKVSAVWLVVAGAAAGWLIYLLLGSF